MATYVIADTHGCINTLKSLLEEQIGISKDDNIYFLGDYIDRGQCSAQLVEYLINLQADGYKLFPLRGNHEHMIIDSMFSTSAYKLWMINSGVLTLESYKELLGVFFTFPQDLPDKHLLFYTKLPYYYEISEKFILIHGGLNYKHKNPLSDTEAMLWGRPSPVPSGFMPGKIIIHGHTPTHIETIKSIVENPIQRLIPLDAGCVYAGKYLGIGYLVALKLDDFTLHYVKNIDTLN